MLLPPTSKVARAALAFTLAAFVLSGCSLARRKPEPASRAPSQTPAQVPSGSAVPQPPPDVLSIPDAVPRAESRSRRGNPPFYEVFGKRYYVLASSDGFVERGTASWYGPGFHAASTSLGEPYDMYAMTAAHKTLPLPAYAEVTNLRNGRKVVVRINDRGPFLGDRLIDLSYVAAHKLDILRNGSALVEVESIVPTSQTAKRPAPVVVPSTQAAEPAAQAQAVEAVAEVAPASVALAAPTLPVERTASAPAGAYYLQLGAFSLRDNAQRFADRMRIDLGALEATFVIVAADNLHRVQAGPYGSRDAALQAAAQIGQALGAAPLLVAPR
jgi:rare lipoprotein A